MTGLAYVAVSRVRSLEDLLLKQMSHERLTAVRNSVNFKFRVSEKKRLGNLSMFAASMFPMV